MPVVLRPNARLERWLRRLGVPFTVEPAAEAPIWFADAPVRVTSPFPLHQVRQLMDRMAMPVDTLEPTDDEGHRWKAILLSLADVPTIDGEGDFDEQTPVLASLESALDLHQALELLLVEHRLALMSADIRRAAARWARFSTALRAHLAVEDRLVGPAYADHAPDSGWPRGGAPDIVDNEHRKIRSKLDRLDADLRTLADGGLRSADLRVRCLALLDRQKVLHDILEHHDMRERSFVYPRLEAVLHEDAKRAIVFALLGGEGLIETPTLT